MRPTPLIGALGAAALGLGLTACGGGGSGDSAEDIRAELSEQLLAIGFQEEAADCYAGVLVEEVGADDLADVDFAAEEPPEELQEELTAAATIANDSCSFDAESLSG